MLARSQTRSANHISFFLHRSGVKGKLRENVGMKESFSFIKWEIPIATADSWKMLLSKKRCIGYIRTCDSVVMLRMIYY